MEKEKHTYWVSAVIKEQLVEDKVDAYTKKQSWYLFACKYGFAMRDFNSRELPKLKDDKVI